METQNSNFKEAQKKQHQAFYQTQNTHPNNQMSIICNSDSNKLKKSVFNDTQFVISYNFDDNICKTRTHNLLIGLHSSPKKRKQESIKIKQQFWSQSEKYKIQSKKQDQLKKSELPPSIFFYGNLDDEHNKIGSLIKRQQKNSSHNKQQINIRKTLRTDHKNYQSNSILNKQNFYEGQNILSKQPSNKNIKNVKNLGNSVEMKNTTLSITKRSPDYLNRPNVKTSNHLKKSFQRGIQNYYQNPLNLKQFLQSPNVKQAKNAQNVNQVSQKWKESNSFNTQKIKINSHTAQFNKKKLQRKNQNSKISKNPYIKSNLQEQKIGGRNNLKYNNQKHLEYSNNSIQKKAKAFSEEQVVINQPNQILVQHSQNQLTYPGKKLGNKSNLKESNKQRNWLKTKNQKIKKQQNQSRFQRSKNSKIFNSTLKKFRNSNKKNQKDHGKKQQIYQNQYYKQDTVEKTNSELTLINSRGNFFDQGYLDWLDEEQYKTKQKLFTKDQINSKRSKQVFAAQNLNSNGNLCNQDADNKGQQQKEYIQNKQQPKRYYQNQLSIQNNKVQDKKLELSKLHKQKEIYKNHQLIQNSHLSNNLQRFNNFSNLTAQPTFVRNSNIERLMLKQKSQNIGVQSTANIGKYIEKDLQAYERAPIISYFYNIPQEDLEKQLSRYNPGLLKKFVSIGKVPIFDFRDSIISQAISILIQIDQWYILRIFQPINSQNQQIGIWLYCDGIWKCFVLPFHEDQSIIQTLKEILVKEFDKIQYKLEDVIKKISGIHAVSLKYNKKSIKEANQNHKKQNIIKALGVSSCKLETKICDILKVQTTVSGANVIQIKTSNQKNKQNQSQYLWIRQQKFLQYFSSLLLIANRQLSYWTYFKVKQKPQFQSVYSIQANIQTLGSISLHIDSLSMCSILLYKQIEPKKLKFIGKAGETKGRSVCFDCNMKGSYYLFIDCEQKCLLSFEGSREISFSFVEFIEKKSMKNEECEYVEMLKIKKSQDGNLYEKMREKFVDYVTRRD